MNIDESQLREQFIAHLHSLHNVLKSLNANTRVFPTLIDFGQPLSSIYKQILMVNIEIDRCLLKMPMDDIHIMNADIQSILSRRANYQLARIQSITLSLEQENHE